LTLLRAGKLSSFMIDSASLRPLQPALSLVEWVDRCMLYVFNRLNTIY